MESQPVRVLLVEDDEDDYFLTRDLLSEIQGQPFHLEWVKDYDTALEAMGRNGHDVYLLDYWLGQRQPVGHPDALLLHVTLRCPRPEAPRSPASTGPAS